MLENSNFAPAAPSYPGVQATTPTTSIYTSCQETIDHLETLTQYRHTHLAPAQQAVLDSTTPKDDHLAQANLSKIETNITETLQYIRNSTLRDVQVALSRCSAGERESARAHVDRVNRRVQSERRELMKSQREFEEALRGQVRRRVGIANPAASGEEVEGVVEEVVGGGGGAYGYEDGGRIFQVSGVRRQNASDAQAAVMSRSAAIRQIEKNLVEISDLSTEIAQLVQKHEPATMQIEEDAREVVKDVEKADTNLSKAIISARNVRKYKWYILFVCLLIIAIVIAVPVAACYATESCGTKSNK